MELTVIKKRLVPMWYENVHNLPSVPATIEKIEPEEPTRVGDEEEPTIKGATVTFRPERRNAKLIKTRMERRKLIRLAHAVGKITTAPGSTADTADLIGGKVKLVIETRRRDGARRVARFVSLNGPFGG